MKSYSSITIKYLKKQKKRAILNIIGIILSVALICSIGTMAYSVKEMEIEKVKQSEGDYYFRYAGVDNSILNVVKNNAKTDGISVIQRWDQPVDITGNLSLTVDKYDMNALKTMPVKLKEGRLPERRGEILVEKWVFENIDGKPVLNSNIRLKEGNEITELKVVGILENEIFTQFSNTGMAITLLESTPENHKIDVFFKLKKGVSIKENVKEFRDISTENFAINGLLLSYMGQNPDSKGDMTYYVIAAILMALVLASTIAVIYNSFHMSVLERIKQFGILRSIGATPDQIKKIVLKEAVILSIVAIPIGILAGIMGLKALLLLIASNTIIKTTEVMVSPLVILISFLIGLLAVCFSAYVPARIASKASPLDAIYNRGSIIKEKIKKKKGFIEKYFNIEALMANKNIRRNRKRFRITTFSIAISIILFISFSSFVNMAFNIQGKGNEELNLSYKVIKINQWEMSTRIDLEKEYEKLRKAEEIDSIYKTYSTLGYQLLIPSEKMNEKYGKLFKEQKISDGTRSYNKMNSRVEVYDKERLEASKKYIVNGSIDENVMNKENGVIIVRKTNEYSETKKKNYTIDVADIKIGDEIPLDLISEPQSSSYPNKTINLKVVGIFDRAPFGDEYLHSEMNIITTKTVMDRIIKKTSESNAEAVKLLGFDIKLKTEANKENIGKAIKTIGDKDSEVRVIDVEDSLNRKKAERLQLSIFLYGFIGVIALIGSLNIINTIGANLILRKREFATLKAVGMGMNQISKMVILEGVFYGLVGAAYGLIISLPISYTVLRLLNRLEGYEWKIPWISILISIAASVLIGLVSVILPLIRIKKGNIMDNIRMEE